MLAIACTKFMLIFVKGRNALLDCFKNEKPELHDKFTHLWQILSNNHKFFGTKVTSYEDKLLAAENCRKFTKLLPIYFPDVNIGDVKCTI